MKLTIRNYCQNDYEKISELFFETVHCVNSKDYTPYQIDAWARDIHCLDKRKDDFAKQRTLIAQIDGEIAGFCSVDDENNYLDMLYVHKNFMRLRVASALCDIAEKGHKFITTHASITAKEFFLKRGYKIVKQLCPVRNGVTLTNFEMRKIIK